MLFNAPLFAVFFTSFVLLYFATTSRRLRLLLVIAASFLFYSAAEPRHLVLLLGSILLTYGFGLLLARTEGAGARRTLLLAGVGVNIAMLFLFKYARFTVESLNAAVATVGAGVALPVPHWALPIGISFFVFQAISYLVDVYRRASPAQRSLAVFAGYLSFFPQVVSGPIVRARQLVPQLEAMATPSWEHARVGIGIFCVGLFKKTLADLLAPVAAGLFHGHGAPSAVEAWIGLVAFAGQMYADFSGYSDMAIGLAAVVGFQLPLNFNLPYLSKTPAEVWTRWHITLSTWIRDYLYWPMGLGHPYRNLLLTWTLAGLWHGASWTFVIWGLYHGGLIAGTRWFERRSEAREWRAPPPWIAVPVTFLLWLLGLSLFGSPNLARAAEVARAAFLPVELGELGSAVRMTAFLCGLGLIVPHAIDALVIRKPALFRRAHVLWLVAYLCAVFAIGFGEPGFFFIYWAF